MHSHALSAGRAARQSGLRAPLLFWIFMTLAIWVWYTGFPSTESCCRKKPLTPSVLNLFRFGARSDIRACAQSLCR